MEGNLDDLIIASTSNPTGMKIPADDLRALVDYSKERGNRYVRFSFAGPFNDMAEAGRRLIDWKR